MTAIGQCTIAIDLPEAVLLALQSPDRADSPEPHDPLKLKRVGSLWQHRAGTGKERSASLSAVLPAIHIGPDEGMTQPPSRVMVYPQASAFKNILNWKAGCPFYPSSDCPKRMSASDEVTTAKQRKRAQDYNVTHIPSERDNGLSS